MTNRQWLWTLLATLVSTCSLIALPSPAALAVPPVPASRNLRLRPHREPRLAIPAEAKVAARLNDPISVNFRDEPAKEAMDYVSAIQELRLEYDADAIPKENSPWAHKVTISLEQVPSRLFFRLLLEPFQLNWVIRGDKLLITTAAEAERHLNLWDYDLGDLVDAGISADELAHAITATITPASWATAGGTGSLEFEKGHFVIGQTRAVQQNVSRLLHNVRRELREPAAQRRAREDRMVTIRYDANRFVEEDPEWQQKFMKSITSQVFPWTWEGCGGRGSLKMFNDELEVTQHEWVHERLARLLDLMAGMVRSSRGGFTNAREAIFFALSEVSEGSSLEEATRRRVSVAFADQELPEILHAIQEEFGVRCRVNQEKLKQAGVVSKRFSIKENNVVLSNVLDRVAGAWGLDWYPLDNSVVLLASPDEAAARQDCRVYRIIELAEAGHTADELVKKITATIEPKSWQPAGGTATIRTLPGLLVVCHNRRTHEHIAEFLESLGEK